MDWEQTYENWKNFSELEEEWREMLIENEKDRTRLEDCFYKNLEFGTGGMRGEIGPGPNRMNTYTVRKASAGLAKYIEEHGEEAKEKGVVIAYDSRYKSPEFAMEAALTLGKRGIRTYVFSDLRPTPELSFAVRYLQAFAGIVITASHNPPEYNGYKVYGLDGGQLPPEPANRLIEKVNDVKDELQIEIEKESELKASGYLQFVDEAIDQAYQEHLQKIVIQPTLIKESGEKVNIVFTPLHGTANLPVREALKNAGFSNVTVVKEQENPDPNFSTVSSPNPEEFSAFTYAIKIGEQCDADLILATDPDADRVGMAVKDTSGKFVTLTGNQIGALMLEYLLSQKKKRGTLPSNGVVFKTIVTSEIGREIASFYGIETIDTLTGFKFIGEKIGEFEKTTEKQFLFGYEESHGYLIGDFVRDKDAVQACLFLAEITSFYQSQNKTVYEGLIEIYEKYGFFQETLDSLTLKGKAGVEKIESVLRHFRRQPLTEIAGEKVNIIEDYKTRERFFVNEQEQEEITLPTANVLKYICVDNTWVCIRPSGTEPKIKFYFGVKGATLAESKQRLARVKADIMEKIHKLTEESD